METASLFFPSMRLRPLSLPLLLLLAITSGAGFTGCAPTKPLDARIYASSEEDFTAWRSKIEPQLAAGEQQELTAALHELRLSITTFTPEVSDPGMVEALVRSRIDGIPLKQLYIDGARLRIMRLYPEQRTLRAALETNSKQLASADAATAEALRPRIERQTERLQKISREISAAETRLLALGVTPPDTTLPLAAAR